MAGAGGTDEPADAGIGSHSWREVNRRNRRRVQKIRLSATKIPPQSREQVTTMKASVVAGCHLLVTSGFEYDEAIDDVSLCARKRDVSALFG
jgi:hypothetical protein